MQSYRIAIVGAGCAGLSLAWHLLDAGIEPNDIVLFDPRTSYTRDRTWCFFDVVKHPFEAQIDHRWHRWRVRASGAGSWIERSAPGLHYAHLPADAFYEAVRNRLAETGVSLRLGVRVGRVRSEPGQAIVSTDQGSVAASLVFDSRPARGEASGEVSLLQHFTGWTVETDEPRFDPEVATLMDFQPSDADGIHFFYELPFDAHSALIEATWFSLGPARPGQHQRALEQRLGGVPHRVRYTESGVIPMTTADFPSRWSERVIPIGLAGGMAKPSTGYAFLTIQAFSAELARRTALTDVPNPPPPRPWSARAQDRLFLQYLVRHQEDAPKAIVGLFERLPPDVLARFLNDRVTPSESLSVMAAMPVLTMGAELLRSPRTWLRP